MKPEMRKFSSAILFLLIFLIGCIEEPVKEDVPELITKVRLIFTSFADGSKIEVEAYDPDGEGIQDIITNQTIILKKNTSYLLEVTFLNELADPTSPEYNITDEVEAEGEEHRLFFAWTEGVFSSPTGNGNVDNAMDEVNYEDADGDGLPLGLSTQWATSANITSGTFQVILKHQPELKSIDSGVDVGETDMDVTFNIQIQ